MKIKVISGFEGHCPFKEPFLKTLTEYCNRFGYEFIPEFGEAGEVFKHQRGFWWGKLHLIEKHLHHCDYLLWIDVDCIATNFSRPLEDLIAKHGDFELLLTKEEVIETGVILFKNSAWARNFLQIWGAYMPEVNDNNHELLKLIVAYEPEITKHFKFVSDVEFTIKHVHFKERTSQTLFVHFPGSTMDDKVKYMHELSQRFNWKEDCYASFINLDHRTDRLKHMQEQLSRIGLNATRTRGLLPQEVNEPHDKIAVMQARTPGAIGCHYSQVSIMETALSLGKSAFVMEDDLIFCADFNKRMEHIENFLNTRDWDIFWLGGTYHVGGNYGWHKNNHGNEPKLCTCTLGKDAEQTDDPRIMRTYGIWGTYAYIVNHKAIPHILNLLDQNVYRSIGIDWLFIMLMPELKTYCFAPGCVKQMDNLSDIGLNGDKPAITYFSGFKNLGPYWYQERMEDFNPLQFNWQECAR